MLNKGNAVKKPLSQEWMIVRQSSASFSAKTSTHTSNVETKACGKVFNKAVILKKHLQQSIYQDPVLSHKYM